MKLYYTPAACSLAAHIVVEEAGLKLDLVKVDLGSHKTEDGQDYYKINPRGYVPAITLDDGTLITEVPVVVQYLADQRPETGLMPREGTADRLHAQSWLVYIDTELHKNFSPLWVPNVSADMRQYALSRLNTRFKEVNERLADHPYIMGEKFTVVDAYAFTILNWTNFQKVDLAAFPHIKTYMARVAARPAVQAALKAEGLV